LREAAEPLHAKEIAKRVIESGRCSGLKGKTPEATIAALLAVGSKPGGPFKRVDKGTYTLADGSTSGDERGPDSEARGAAAHAEAADGEAGRLNGRPKPPCAQRSESRSKSAALALVL
ncbi:MAG: winged helix-turn-helix domain-containing protein, partial [Acidimicrobiia bacterium]